MEFYGEKNLYRKKEINWSKIKIGYLLLLKYKWCPIVSNELYKFVQHIF